MTGGCRWQEKSFNVVVSEKNTITCKGCDKEIECVYKFNGDNFCKDCFSLQGKGSFIGANFTTHKDLKYNFVTDMFGAPVEIHSKRQFQRLLKQHGMVDASPKECVQEARFRKKLNEEDIVRDRRKMAEEIFSRNKELIRSKYGRRK